MRKTGELKGNPLTEMEAKIAFKLLFDAQEERFYNTRAAYLSALGLTEEDLTEAGIELSTLQLIGFKLEEIRRQLKKEAKFSRVVDGGSAQAIKKAAERGLMVRLNVEGDDVVKDSAVKELAALKGRVTVENTKNTRMHTALAIIAALGVATTVLGFIALPPAGAIALIVLTLVLAGAMMVTDGYCMLEGWKKGGVPGRYDKAYIVAISSVLLAALGVSIGVTLGFGLPLIPLILAAVMGTAALGLTSTAYYKLVQKEKHWKEAHPDLETFKKALLDSDKKLETVTNLYKKLPKVDRQAIRKQYDKSRDLKKDSHFVEAYLAQENKEHALLEKAMKKTVKFFWEKAAQTKSISDQNCALKMQGLRDRVGKKITFDAILAEIKNNYGAVYKQLENDLWFMIKRTEDKTEDLGTIIDQVIAAGKDRPVVA